MTATHLPRTTDHAGADHLRPVAHFTAHDTWLNDPNGLLYHEGTWHLFFQNNPYGSTWGNMSWGHATSTDLITWQHHPVAIPATATEQAYSGSAVLDAANTTGFADPGQAPLVAIYTSLYTGDHPRAGIQAQSLAYSLDDGQTWQHYEHNPVLDIGSTEFRDPKVFWYGGAEGHWVMVAVEATKHQVAIYTSPNLVDWTFASRFGPAGSTGGVWECPDLFELPVRDTGERRWVMIVSLNPGGIAGGSGTQYFVGHFDGRTFTTATTMARAPRTDACQNHRDDAAKDRSTVGDRVDWLDFGRDYYAAVSFTNAPDDRRIMIGWASNWDYANTTPTAPWRSAMSLAREVDLVRWPDGRLRISQRPILPEHDVPGLVVHDIVVPTGRGQRTQVELSTQDRSDTVRLVLDGDAQTLACDRTDSGDVMFHPEFPSVDTAPLPDQAHTRLQIVIDACVLEVYAADGRVTLTQLVFPGSPLSQLTQKAL